MANPQPDKFTKLSNEILETIVKFKFNATQLKIIMIVWRYTYGFQRKEHSLSLNFIAEAISSNKQVVKRELDLLIKSNVLLVAKEAGFNTAREIGFNKNYEQWSIPIGLLSTNENTVPDEVDTQYTNRTTTEYTNKSTKKEKYKENIKERDFKSVFDYYLTLDLVKHRAYTKDMQKAITKAVKDNRYEVEYCKTLLKRHKEVVEKSKNAPYPIKVRGFAEFFGQKVYGATHLICSEYEEGGKYYEQYIKSDKSDNRLGVPPCESVLGKREVPWM